MSLLSSFIRNQLLKAVEKEFVDHAPDMQALIVKEIGEFASECVAWVESKVSPKAEEVTDN